MANAASLDDGIRQAREMLRGLSLRQRALVLGGALLVGVILWAFVGLMGNPKYVTLYSGLSPSDAQSLTKRLTAKKIPYQLSSDGGSLLVPEEQLDASRLETAAQGLPSNARLGFELFDTPNWAGSDFGEKVNYQRALEGELERTLQTLSDVEAVRVHLVLPHESLFAGQESVAKAAVILKTRAGHLSESAEQAIPQLVASAVDRLKPENVTVVDADTNSPLLHARELGSAAGAYLADDELAKTLVKTLEPVAGADHVRASVHVEYDTSTSENTEEVYDPKSTAAITQQKSEELMGGAAPGGVAGTASNMPGSASTAVADSGDNQSSRSESATFVVSKSVRHISQPPGRIRRLAAAVLIDDGVEASASQPGKPPARRKRTSEEMKQIEQLASAAIGVNSQRGDVLSIQNLSFQEMPVEQPAAATKIQKTRQLLTEWAGALRYAGIAALFLIVYFLILRPVKKQVLAAFRELPGRVLQASRPAAQVSEGGALSAGVEIELPAGSEGAKRAAALKKQLTERVKSEPAAAGRLVQSWLREDGA